ncbi:hypothetical protein F4775DRAFT_591174 [Biscogniauxia sp. FL1348]|nr:hypothetical protein F4775DRAFT_591174 [Biscogniauxia sp. FL1348]
MEFTLINISFSRSPLPDCGSFSSPSTTYPTPNTPTTTTAALAHTSSAAPAMLAEPHHPGDRMSERTRLRDETYSVPSIQDAAMIDYIIVALMIFIIIVCCVGLYYVQKKTTRNAAAVLELHTLGESQQIPPHA